MNELEEIIKRADEAEDKLADLYESLEKVGQVRKFAQVAGALRDIRDYLEKQRK